MAQLGKTVYTIDREPVVVESNSSANWFAGVLIAMVAVIIGAFIMLINNSNNENSLELQKIQQDQSNLQMQQSNLSEQQAKQDANAAQQASIDARQASTQYELNAKQAQQSATDIKPSAPVAIPSPSPAPEPAVAPPTPAAPTDVTMPAQSNQ